MWCLLHSLGEGVIVSRAPIGVGRASISHRVAVIGRIVPGQMVLELALDVGQQARGAEAEQLGLQPWPAELFLHQHQPVERGFCRGNAAGRLEADEIAGFLEIGADGAHHGEADGQRRVDAFLAGRGLDEIRARHHRHHRGQHDIAQRGEVAGAEDDLEMRLTAGGAHGDDLVVELLPFGAEHQAARDDDVDLVGAVLDRGLDLLQARRQRREAVRKGGGDGGDMDAGAAHAHRRRWRRRDDRRRPPPGGSFSPAMPSAFDDVAAERIDRLGAQPAHALLGVVGIQRRQVHAGDGAQQPGRLVVGLDRAPLGQAGDAALERRAVDAAHRFHEAEIEPHAGVAGDAVPRHVGRIRSRHR